MGRRTVLIVFAILQAPIRFTPTHAHTHLHTHSPKERGDSLGRSLITFPAHDEGTRFQRLEPRSRDNHVLALPLPLLSSYIFYVKNESRNEFAILGTLAVGAASSGQDRGKLETHGCAIHDFTIGERR